MQVLQYMGLSGARRTALVTAQAALFLVLYRCIMFFNCRIQLLAIALAALTSPAAADSLGFRFADLTAVSTTNGNAIFDQTRASVDFAITDQHGVQFDLGATGYQGEYLGQLDGHLYMMPTQGAKYGLFFSLADMDGREATVGLVGVEGMFAISDSTEVHGRAGIGMALPGNMDFITLSLGASHALSDQVAIYGGASVTEFDEAALRAVGTTARLGVSYQPLGRPWEISAAFVRDGLTGRDAAAFETRAEVGFTWHLGAGGGAKRSLAARSFANPQPFDPLLRRGMF